MCTMFVFKYSESEEDAAPDGSNAAIQICSWLGLKHFTSDIGRGLWKCREGDGERRCAFVKKEALSEELCSFLYVL